MTAFERGELTSRPTVEVLAAMRQATLDLISLDATHKALRARNTAPNFTLLDSSGVRVSSRILLARGPLVVTFMWGDWCPTCDVELAALQHQSAAFVERGASVVAITPQTVTNNRRSVSRLRLTFPLLSDHRNRVAHAFGIRFKLPEYLIAAYKEFGNDLPTVNNDDSWTLPLPARFVIRPNGVVMYSEVDPDYTRRPEPAELMPLIRNAVE